MIVSRARGGILKKGVQLKSHIEMYCTLMVINVSDIKNERDPYSSFYAPN